MPPLASSSNKDCIKNASLNSLIVAAVAADKSAAMVGTFVVLSPWTTPVQVDPPQFVPVGGFAPLASLYPVAAPVYVMPVPNAIPVTGAVVPSGKDTAVCF